MSSIGRTGKFHVSPVNVLKRVNNRKSESTEALIDNNIPPVSSGDLNDNDQISSVAAASSSAASSSSNAINPITPPSWSGNVVRRKRKGGKGSSEDIQANLDPVFKMPLRAVMIDQGQGYIPYIVQKCFHFISKYLSNRGLFRINGNVRIVEQLVKEFDSGRNIRIEDFTRDPNDVCSLLKRFISDLPEPIFNQKLTEQLLLTLNQEDTRLRLIEIRDICDQLDEYNHALLECLFYFLKDVAKYSDRNKMDINNLSTIFGPILTQQPDCSMLTSFNNARSINSVIFDMISNTNLIFGIKELSGNFADHYHVGDELGSGGFAVVYLVTEKSSGQKFAAKVIKRNKLEDVDMKRVADEIDILRRVRHPNIISLRAVFQTSDEIILVMELAEGGELFDKLVDEGQYNEDDASRILKQIVSAVEYLHSLNIAHRDLKPENILLKNKTTREIKIADFGLSKVFDKVADAHTYCGTPNYVAPEILFGDLYGTPVDMWSIGVVAYVLLGGEPPFHDNNMRKLFEQIKSGDYDFPDKYWKHISDEAKDFIDKLLVIDENKRMSATEALKHPFLSKRSKTLDAVLEAGRLARENKIRKEMSMAIRQEPSQQEENILRAGTIRPAHPGQNIHEWKNVRIKVIKECKGCKSYIYPFYKLVYSCEKCGIKCHKNCAERLNSRGCGAK